MHSASAAVEVNPAELSELATQIRDKTLGRLIDNLCGLTTKGARCLARNDMLARLERPEAA